MRPFHLGAYERLWAEHRYSVLAVSQEEFNSLGRKLRSKAPKILSFLKRISWLSSQPKLWQAYSLLYIYGYFKNSISEKEKRFLIEGIIDENPIILDDFYRFIISKKVSYLYGCRLFFPPLAKNKYWDFDDNVSLCLCMGPYFVRLFPSTIRRRIEKVSQGFSIDFDWLVKKLKFGLSRNEYDLLPEPLRFSLEQNGMVALLPGTAFLHPRIPVALPSEPNEEVSPGHAALLALEQIWDKFPEYFFSIPQFAIWENEFSSENLPGIQWDQSACKFEIFSVISREFVEQQALE